MSIEIMSAVWNAETKLSSSCKMVLLKLADNANDSGVCWPSQSMIAKRCEIDRSTANRAIKTLVDRGFIAANSNYKNNIQTVCSYTINFEALRCCRMSQRSLLQDVTANQPHTAVAGCHTEPSRAEPSVKEGSKIVDVIGFLNKWSVLTPSEIQKWRSKINEFCHVGVSSEDQSKVIEWMEKNDKPFPKVNFWTDTYRQFKKEMEGSKSTFNMVNINSIPDPDDTIFRPPFPGEEEAKQKAAELEARLKAAEEKRDALS